MDSNNNNKTKKGKIMQELTEIFKTGEKYTLFKIDSMMAMTHKSEIIIKDIDPEGNPIFSEKGKRKKYRLRLKSKAYASAPEKPLKSAIFAGWDQPFTCDTDSKMGTMRESGILSRTMRGNACYNFIGTQEQIRIWIDKGQINPHFDKTAVLSIENNEGDGDVVYPDLYKGGHAVIDRQLAKA